ncbi:MAG: zf-HC2 domain-containing protein [Anaerolineae bacterium]
MLGFRKSEHQRIREMLSAYLDGELTPRDRARVERHLGECAACAEDLRTLRWTVGLMKEVPPLPIPRSFTIPAPVAERRAGLFQPGWGYAFLRGATALATALLVLVLSGDLLSQRFLRAPAPALAPVVKEIETPLRALEAQKVKDLTPVEKEVEKALAPSAKAVPTPPQTIAPEIVQAPAPPATPEQLREAPPRPPEERRLSLLRQIEAALLLATILLASATMIVGRRYSNG